MHKIMQYDANNVKEANKTSQRGSSNLCKKDKYTQREVY